MTIQEMCDKKMYYHLWILSRYLYRVGEEPILTDATYDKITELLKEKYYDVAKEYLERTYDDDPIPYAILKMVDMEPIEFDSLKDRGDYANALDEEKSLSINSVTSYEDAFSYCLDKKKRHLDLIASLKMDGVNHKDLYVNDQLKLSLSRGRAGFGFDFTKQIFNCLPFKISSGMTELKVTGECYVAKEGLPVLRDRYNNDKYKTSKSAAISLLRVEHAPEDYRFLRAKVFSADGLATTLEETFQKLSTMGFDVVPYFKVKWEEIPEDLVTFKSWFYEKVMTPIHDMQMEDNMPADGLVLQVNDLLWEDTISGQYSDKQLACKFEYWSFDVYKAVVTDIVITQRRVNASVRIKIEPLVTNDDCKAQWINGFNPSILFANNIKVGTEAYFERNSGAVNILIHGKRLDDLLKE